MNILQKIISVKQREIAEHKKITSQNALLQHLEKCERKKFSFRKALLASPTGIIAELKRRSPSKDWLNKTAKVEEIVPKYAAAGATAISVLTDEQFFGGSAADLQTARKLVDIPLLRKDFIIDEYQIFQAALWGADVILLIASALTVEENLHLAKMAKKTGLEVLLEIHSENELAYINEFVDVVGINNRNLSTFITDVETSFVLGEKIPPQFVKISESGISAPETVKKLRKVDFRGFLMGENFMKTTQPATTLAEFIANLR